MPTIKKKDGFKDQRHLVMQPDILQAHKSHPLVNGSLLYEIGYYPLAKFHYRERYHEHTENILIYCLEGEGFVEVNETNRYALKRGDIFCIPENTPHHYYSLPDNPWSILWAHFETPLVDYFNFKDMRPITVDTPQKSALIQSHFINLLDIAEKSNSLENTICLSQLLTLVLSEIFFFKDSLDHDKQHTYLSKGIHYLTEHLAEPLTLSDLANHLNISQSYLSSIFAKYLNTSPIDYLINLRIEQACRYLRMTDLKIYEIAQKVGYHDPFYFSRLFKKITAQTPKAYRKQIQQNVLPKNYN